VQLKPSSLSASLAPSPSTANLVGPELLATYVAVAFSALLWIFFQPLWLSMFFIKRRLLYNINLTDPPHSYEQPACPAFIRN